MRRARIVLLLGAAATLACEACGHEPDPPHPIRSTSATATVAASAHHPPPTDVPAATPMDLPEPSVVYVPSDHEVSAEKTAQTVVEVPGGTPAAKAPVKVASLPRTHAGDAKAWECLSHDECYFARMPFYNQANPNLSRVEVPKAIFDAERKGKVTGPLEWDEAANRWAVVLKPKTAKTPDPYYNTWLPFGPLNKKDDGFIGYHFTELCGPAGESMALMAALAARSPKTKVKAGSWTETRFILATKPDAQAALPSPLLEDHSSLAPDGHKMSAEDIQRLINMAVRQRTNPMAGGGDDTFLHVVKDFEPVNGKPPVQTRAGGHPTNKLIMDAIRDGFAPVVVIAGYKASFKPVEEGGKTVKYTLTFSRNMGHILAVNGFFLDQDNKPTLLIYNPLFAAPTTKRIIKASTKGLEHEGLPVEVKGPAGGDYLSLLEEVSAPNPHNPKSCADIKDGQEIYMFDGYAAIKLD